MKESCKVRLVLDEERFSDLEKCIWSVSNHDVSFDHFHLCAALTTDHIEKFGFPSDLTLSPQEMVQLYDPTMFEFWKSCLRAQELCPENKVNSFYFANKVVIRKMDARKCEESLKAELTSWVKNGHINKARMVLESVHPPSVLGPGCSENMAIMFLLLVAKLREMEKLPACFFLHAFFSSLSKFDLGAVERRAERVEKFLQRKQERRRPPRADRETRDVANELHKVAKIHGEIQGSFGHTVYTITEGEAREEVWSPINY
ncbi:LOW QUALITY PROTEIN: probable ATP-dependent RNA helicase DDX60 [Ovis aries]|uniref:LOW QUALITY PROTEIN: probable ATP-dependent RNA helicase DDX60 n=1 Tax=Ovis aries TaxID=9940 RepID=UPI0029529230|nr:LOW QUALITY PROTEIN: probable ATP-dependent RNA helicase DDX60 [Ovis aries]